MDSFDLNDDTPENDQIGTDEVDLRAAIQHAVMEIIEQEDAQSEGGSADIHTKTSAQNSIAELVFMYATTCLGPDLVAFSQHAARKTITEDDVKLVARRNPAGILEKLEEFGQEHFSAMGDETTDATKKPRGRSASRQRPFKKQSAEKRKSPPKKSKQRSDSKSRSKIIHIDVDDEEIDLMDMEKETNEHDSVSSSSSIGQELLEAEQQARSRTKLQQAAAFAKRSTHDNVFLKDSSSSEEEILARRKSPLKSPAARKRQSSSILMDSSDEDNNLDKKPAAVSKQKADPGIFDESSDDEGDTHGSSQFQLSRRSSRQKGHSASKKKKQPPKPKLPRGLGSLYDTDSEDDYDGPARIQQILSMATSP